ncbi:hypothetical protein AB0P21_39210 [Kribbella sp. NPDC056861]|uniref:sensor histidine kinase n=1 Tax=Kribbella sp. NPDC056861 TaxID=3154857 RepID=UPI00341352C8
MAAVIGLLRNPSEPLAPPPSPAPGLAGLAALLGNFAAAGLRVDHQQHGEARDLPQVTDLTAYRIVQESLTNAHKYGEGTAKVTVVYSPQGVAIEVSNPVRSGTNFANSGYGIIGMRERVSVAGGSLLADLTPGAGFMVRADLPTPDGPAI